MNRIKTSHASTELHTPKEESRDEAVTAHAPYPYELLHVKDWEIKRRRLSPRDPLFQNHQNFLMRHGLVASVNGR